jgi:hypothetical protein
MKPNPFLDRSFILNGLALGLAAAVVLAHLCIPAVPGDAAGLALAFVTACFAIINRNGRGPQDPTPPVG